MNVSTGTWEGRRILMTGCDGFLGAAVARELLAQGATVVGLFPDRAGGAEYVPEIAAGRFLLVRGNPRDASRLHATMAVHEVSAVFHLSERETDAAPVIRAAGLYHPRVAVIRAIANHRLSIAGSMESSSSPVGTIRFDELFGPGDRDTSQFIPQTILTLLAGRTVVPAAGGERDYVFIRAAAHSCIELAEAVGRAGHALDHTVRSGWLFSDAQMIKVLANAISGSPPGSDSPAIADAVGETIEWYRQFAATSSLTRVNRRAA